MIVLVIILSCTTLFFLALSVVFFLRARRNSHYRRLVESLPADVYVCRTDGKVIYAHEVESTNPIETVADIKKFARQNAQDVLMTVFDSPKPLHLEYESGHSYRALRGYTLDDFGARGKRCAILVSLDISHLRDSVRHWQHDSARLESILQSIGDGVIVTDLHNRITLMNATACTYCGVTREEALGKPIELIFKLQHLITGKRIRFKDDLAVLSGEPLLAGDTHVLLSRTKQHMMITDNAAPVIDADGRPAGNVVLFRDISDQYQQLNEKRALDTLLADLGEKTKFSIFRFDLKTRLTHPVAGSRLFRPMVNGEQVPIDQWLMPEDARAIAEQLSVAKIQRLDYMSRRIQTRDALRPHFYDFCCRRINTMNESDIENGEVYGFMIDVTADIQYAQMRDRNRRIIQALFDFIPDIFFSKTTTAPSRVITANAAAHAALSLDATLEGRTDYELFRTATDASIFASHPTNTEFEMNYTNVDGKTYTVNVLRKTYEISIGETFELCLLRDVGSARERAQAFEQKIETLSNEISGSRAVNDCLTYASMESDFEKSINFMLETIGTQAGADLCSVWLYEDGMARMRYAWRSSDVFELAKRVQVFELAALPELNAQLNANGHIAIESVNSLAREHECFEMLMRARNISAMMVGALRSHDGIKGFIALSYVGKRHVFTPGDLHLLNDAVNLYAIAEQRHEQYDSLESERFVRSDLFHSLSMPMVLLDMQRHIVEINDEFFHQLRIPRRNVKNAMCTHYCPMHRTLYCAPERCALWQTILSGAEQTQIVNRKRFRGTLKTHPIYDEHDRARYVLVSFTNVPELNRRRELSILTLNLNEFLQRCSELLVTGHSTPECMRILLNLLRQQFKFDALYFMRFHPMFQQSLEFDSLKHGSAVIAGNEPTRLDRSLYPNTFARLNNNQIVFVNKRYMKDEKDVDVIDQELHELLSERHIDSFVLIPIFLDTQFYGAIAAVSNVTIGTLSPESVFVYKNIARMIGLLLGNRTEYDINPLRTHFSEQFLNALDLPICITDAQRRIVYVNAYGAKVFDDNETDLIGLFCHQTKCPAKVTSENSPCTNAECPINVVHRTHCGVSSVFMHHKRAVRLRSRPVISESGDLLYTLQTFLPALPSEANQITADVLCFSQNCPVTLDALMDQLHNEFLWEFNTHNIHFQFTYDPNLPQININFAMLYAMIRGLLNTVIQDHLSEGLVFIHAAFDYDEKTVKGTLTLTIRCIGQVYSPDELREIADGSFNSANYRVREMIHIAQSCEAIHGKMTLDALPGKGTIYTLSFPNVMFNRTAAFSNEQKEQVWVMAATPSDLNLICAQLKHSNFAVDAFASEIELYDELLSRRPQALLLYEPFPEHDCDALNMLHNIREQAPFKKMPIFIVVEDPEADHNIVLTAFSGILHKPLTDEDIVLMRAILKR